VIDAQEAVVKTPVNTPMNRRFAAWLVVPWSGFVAAFLYYTLLTTLLLGGVSPAAPVVAMSYVAPLLAYGAWLAVRLVGGISVHAVRGSVHRAQHFAAIRGA
jgi:hypothetical protein